MVETQKNRVACGAARYLVILITVKNEKLAPL
jgi:hypothetical protein